MERELLSLSSFWQNSLFSIKTTVGYLLVLMHTSAGLKSLVTSVNWQRRSEKQEPRRVIILQLNTSFWMPRWFGNKSLNDLHKDRCKTCTKLHRQFRCFAFWVREQILALMICQKTINKYWFLIHLACSLKFSIVIYRECSPFN